MTLPRCCIDFDIQVYDLLFPERLTPEGQEFFEATGLYMKRIKDLRMVDMGNGWLKVFHRCQYLQDSGECGIYDKRPAICRAYDCSVRNDCACKGTGRVTSP